MQTEQDDQPKDTSVLRVFLDTNGFDVLAADEETLALVEAMVAAGKLELVTLPYVLSEVAAIPNREKAERLLRLTTAPDLPVAVWGVTAWGEAVWGDHQLAATFEDATGEHLDKHYVDAQGLVTAQRLGLPLVTADKLLLKKAQRNGVPSMTPSDLLDQVRQMATAEKSD